MIEGPFLTFEELESRALVPWDHRESYGPAPQQVGELRLPPGRGPHPVVVLIHGGCWQSLATLTYMGALARALAEEGWATWSLEFRRIDETGGAWPGILEDVTAGVAHLPSLSASHPVDPGRLVVAGHSSGAHLALCLAARPPLPVRGVISFAGITDIHHFHTTGEDRRGCGNAVERLLGGAPEAYPRRLATANPTSRLPLGVPQLVLSGAHDRIVPSEHGAWWAARAREAGDPVAHHVVEGSAHFELVSPWTGAWSAGTRKRVVEYLRDVTAESQSQAPPGAPS